MQKNDKAKIIIPETKRPKRTVTGQTRCNYFDKSVVFLWGRKPLGFFTLQFLYLSFNLLFQQSVWSFFFIFCVYSFIQVVSTGGGGEGHLVWKGEGEGVRCQYVIYFEHKPKRQIEAFTYLNFDEIIVKMFLCYFVSRFYTCSTEHLTATNPGNSARTSATCSLASSRESSTSNPGAGPYR